MADAARQVAAIKDFYQDQQAFTYPIAGNRCFMGKAEKTSPFLARHGVHIHRDKFLFLNEKRYDVLAVDVDDVAIDAHGYEPGLDPATYQDVPRPNYSVCSGRGHYQAFWILKDPLPPKPSPKSMEFFRDIRDGLSLALNGDFAFNARGAARNPFCADLKARRWHGDRYTLEELNTDNPLFRQIRMAQWTSEYTEGNRNRATFLFALKIYQDNPNQATVNSLIQQVEFYQQSYDVAPLDRAENACIVKSVLRNGYKYKLRSDRNYGAMNLPEVDWSSMSAQERQAEIKRRQRAGALDTARKKREATTDKIRNAILELEEAGKRATQKVVAEKTGLSLRTVKSYWNIKKKWR